MTEHTCTVTQATSDGSVPPPCQACLDGFRNNGHFNSLQHHRAAALRFLFPRDVSPSAKMFIETGALDSAHWHRGDFTALHDLSMYMARKDLEVVDAYERGRQDGIQQMGAAQLTQLKRMLENQGSGTINIPE